MNKPELTKTPSGKILVIAPHADDEMFGPGGTLIKIKDEFPESKIFILYTTDFSMGKGSDMTELRRQEALAVATKLNFEFCFQMNCPDGQGFISERAAQYVADIIDEVNPNHIFVPYMFDPHADHVAANKLLAFALTTINVSSASITIWVYEVLSPMLAGALVDITFEMFDKVACMELYKSQMEIHNYIKPIRALNTFRGFQAGCEYAEAFIIQSAAEYVDTFLELSLQNANS